MEMDDKRICGHLMDICHTSVVI
jgi:hypothetical protein